MNLDLERFSDFVMCPRCNNLASQVVTVKSILENVVTLHCHCLDCKKDYKVIWSKEVITN